MDIAGAVDNPRSPQLRRSGAHSDGPNVGPAPEPEHERTDQTSARDWTIEVNHGRCSHPASFSQM